MEVRIHLFWKKGHWSECAWSLQAGEAFAPAWTTGPCSQTRGQSLPGKKLVSGKQRTRGNHATGAHRGRLNQDSVIAATGQFTSPEQTSGEASCQTKIREASQVVQELRLRLSAGGARSAAGQGLRSHTCWVVLSSSVSPDSLWPTDYGHARHLCPQAKDQDIRQQWYCNKLKMVHV